jgi:hypothetical protein
MNHMARRQLTSGGEDGFTSGQAAWKACAAYLTTCFQDFWASFVVNGAVDSASAK